MCGIPGYVSTPAINKCAGWRWRLMAITLPCFALYRLSNFMLFLCTSSTCLRLPEHSSIMWYYLEGLHFPLHTTPPLVLSSWVPFLTVNNPPSLAFLVWCLSDVPGALLYYFSRQAMLVKISFETLAENTNSAGVMEIVVRRKYILKARGKAGECNQSLTLSLL